MKTASIAVVGGGINGLCIARQLSIEGYRVSLFEKNTLLSATSSSSSKLLHGGLRYLEQKEFSLVRESLKQRTWWLKNFPQYCHWLSFTVPLYQDSRINRWLLKAGLSLYDILAFELGTQTRHHRFCSRAELVRNQRLKSEQLRGGYCYFDVQMNEIDLGRAIAIQAQQHGAKIAQHTDARLSNNLGGLCVNQTELSFDIVINAAGPWSQQLLIDAEIPSDFQLRLVRGSHLIIDRPLDSAYLLQVPNDNRIVFVMPYHGQTLLGTTEVEQTIEQPIIIDETERRYLIDVYNHYFQHRLQRADIVGDFSGLRPLVSPQQSDITATQGISREYAIETNRQLISVFGGKWTTAPALAHKVSNAVKQQL
jgi:glycerol-3-phosphate dehydrogenase